MNAKTINQILQPRPARWPFQRHATAWLTTLTLFLFGLLLPVRAQDPSLNPKFPADTNASLGATVSFRVIAISTNPPLTFQWQHEGTNLPGATNYFLVLTNLAVADAGGYMAWVTNAGSEFTNTRTATLTVDTTFTKITQGRLVTDLEGSVTATWIDYDQDGYLDLFVGNVSNSGSDGYNSLYHNNRDGSFSKITTNYVGATLGQAWGVAWGDYDNDGKPDLYVANMQNRRPAFFHNDGGGKFTPVITGKLVDTAVDGIMPLWGDYDNDGFIDLFLSTGYWSGPQNDRLYHNEGNSQFRMTTAAEVGDVVNDKARSLAFGWIDFNNTGDLDLFVQYTATSGNKATNFLFRNSLNGPFEKLALTNFNAVGQSWGVAWGDYDNDGYPDAFLAAWFGNNALFKNLQGQGFTNVAETAGLVKAMASNASAWGDYDNDGWLDLFVGNYEGNAGFPGGHTLFHNNHDGTFTRITTNSLAHDGGKATGAAWGDYNNDGFLDLYVACGDGDPQRNLLYRNNGNSNHWLKINLLGTASNRLGIGAKVRVLAKINGQDIWQMRTISGQHSWVSDNGLIAHFGLGDATNVDLIQIEWPSGNVQEIANVAPDLKRTVTEAVNITPVRPTASLNGSVMLTRSTVASASYQWQFNGLDLAGQTNRILNLTNIIASQEGRYSVVVSNEATFTTNFVYLFVDPTFTKITEGPLVTDLGCFWGSSWGDYDGDGFADLFVARWKVGTSAVYHNSANGTFTRAAPLPFMKPSDGIGPWADLDNDGRLDMMAWGETGGTVLYFDDGQGNWSSYRFGSGSPIWWSIALVDYNEDGFLDVYFTNFGNSNNRLYRNNGNRTFTWMSASDIGALANVSSFGGASWADFDDDGWLDLYAGSMQGNRSLMFRNDGTGHFVAVNNLLTATAGPALSGAWGDYDNDGRLDLCVASWGGTTMVYRNLGGGAFERTTGMPTLPGSNNSASWADYDNDGFLDLFLSGYTAGNKLFHNNGDGSFAQVTTGSVVADRAIAGAGTYQGMWFDYDRDGFLDLYVGNGDDGASVQAANFLYHNNTNGNHWLDVRLVGTTSNPSGFGAKVRARARFAGQNRWQRRDISAGDFYNGNNLTAHFGLADATLVNILRIEWPSGTVQEIPNVAVDQMLTVIEPRRPVLAVAVTPTLVTGTLTGDTNQVYQLQVSDDAARGWAVLTNVTTDASGKGNWSDPGAAPQGRRFYKAVKNQ